jgi:hypothetical protein
VDECPSASRLRPSAIAFELQVVPATSVYAPQRVAGLIDMTRIDLSLPVTG